MRRRNLSKAKREALWNDCCCHDAHGTLEDHPRCNDVVTQDKRHD